MATITVSDQIKREVQTAKILDWWKTLPEREKELEVRDLIDDFIRNLKYPVEEAYPEVFNK